MSYHIDELSSNSAAGLDGFPAIPLKKCKGALARLLQILFQNFLTTRRLPTKLKEGIICPIHKGISTSETKNYRPVIFNFPYPQSQRAHCQEKN